MCGITGYISKEADASTAERERLLDAMCKSILHRGPDEQGTLVRGRAALGMRRLSIIDLKTGQQPIFSSDGNLAIVFNGEIYNFRDIRRELESLGHKFKTNSDTEVIVHAYERFGPACLLKLRGMFAIAIWDFREESLFLARDRVGKKPLFYSITPTGEFIFGSELKTLLTHGGISREIDNSAIDAYLTFGYVPEEFCIFKNVAKLPPGHFAIFKNGQLTTERYWDFAAKTAVIQRSEEEIRHELRETIKDAVSVRLISEVPLGEFLSGGVDSSTIVAMMTELSNTPVKTFSIGFNEDSFDELKYAKKAAKAFGTEHHEFIVTPEMFDIADDLVSYFDEPFADSSALPTYMVSKLAREFVTVILSGDGGDELFAGYTRYDIDRRRAKLEMLPRPVRRHLLRRFSEMLPHRAFGKNYLYNISLDPIDRYIDSVSYFNLPRKRSLYAADFRQQLNGAFGAGEREFKSFAAIAGDGDPTNRLLYLDSKTYLPSDILTKVDRMSMANSLEARAPLLDHELIEFAATIPSNLKMKGSETKYILKKAMEGVVPNEILYREKQGFGVPIGDWINAQLRTRILSDLSDRRSRERGYFNESYISTLIGEHSSGRRDHSHALWSLWMLELWHRRYIDG